MVTPAVDSPFGEGPVPEIPLDRAPLALVVAQLRFPTLAVVGTQEFIAPFQEALRGRYPIMRAEKQVSVLLSSEGATEQAQGVVWRFHEPTPGWSVALSPDFVAIETTAYTNRENFLERWREAIACLHDLVKPAVFDRLGVRYVDRLTKTDAEEDLGHLIRTEILGALAIEMPTDADFVASLSQTHFRLDGPEMEVRWGRVPPGALLPGVEPVDEASWFLDIDVHVEGPKPFSVDDVVDASRHSANHAYRFFRWAVTEEFLRRFGGSVELDV